MFAWHQLDVTGAPAPRWAHSFTRISDNRLLVFGGLLNSQSSEAGVVFVFDADAQRWSEIRTSGHGPQARWGHSATFLPLGRKLCVLGGREGTKPLPLSQCFLLDTDTYEWTTIPDVHAVADDGGRAGAAPKNRYAHSVALLSEHSATAPAAAAPAGAPAAGAATEAAISASSRAYAARLLMFGGHGGRSRYFSDVAELIISVPTAVSERPEAKWVSISCTGTPPPRRSGHAMVHLGHRCFVFGGYNGRVYFDDLHLLDMNRWVWSKLKFTGAPLPALLGHSCTPLDSSGGVIVFGGSLSPSQLSSALYALDLNSLTCSAVTVSGEQPAPRFWHRTSVLRDATGHLKLYAFGGACAGGVARDDMYTIDVSPLIDQDADATAVQQLFASMAAPAEGLRASAASGVGAGAGAGAATATEAWALGGVATAAEAPDADAASVGAASVVSSTAPSEPGAHEGGPSMLQLAGLKQAHRPSPRINVDASSRRPPPTAPSALSRVLGSIFKRDSHSPPAVAASADERAAASVSLHAAAVPAAAAPTAAPAAVSRPALQGVRLGADGRAITHVTSASSDGSGNGSDGEGEGEGAGPLRKSRLFRWLSRTGQKQAQRPHPAPSPALAATLAAQGPQAHPTGAAAAPPGACTAAAHPSAAPANGGAAATASASASAPSRAILHQIAILHHQLTQLRARRTRAAAKTSALGGTLARLRMGLSRQVAELQQLSSLLLLRQRHELEAGAGAGAGAGPVKVAGVSLSMSSGPGAAAAGVGARAVLAQHPAAAAPMAALPPPGFQLHPRGGQSPAAAPPAGTSSWPPSVSASASVFSMGPPAGAVATAPWVPALGAAAVTSTRSKLSGPTLPASAANAPSFKPSYASRPSLPPRFQGMASSR